MTGIMDGQECLFDPVTASGKTCPEPCPATTAKTSRPSSRSSQGLGSRTLPMCLCLRRENGPKPGASTMSWGGWSIAYRIHDAQYWGVPQRRRRISVLADFNGLSAAEILFDPQLRGETENTESDETERDPSGKPGREVPPVCESVSGNIEPGGTERQGTSDGAERLVADVKTCVSIVCPFIGCCKDYNNNVDRSSGCVTQDYILSASKRFEQKKRLEKRIAALKKEDPHDVG